MTATALVISRLVLAGVMLVASAGKLLDRAGTRESLAAFGVPARLVHFVSYALPVVEVIVAALLLGTSTALVGAAAALVLLTAFSVVVAWNLRRGNTPDCHCFGALSSGEISRWTLVRNVLLVVPAIAILMVGAGDPGPSLTNWLGSLSGASLGVLALGVALAAAVYAGGWLILGLLRQQGRLLLRIEALEAGSSGAHTAVRGGVPVGVAAPAFALPDASGTVTTLESLLDGARPLLLVFSDPNCKSCAQLKPWVAGWQRDHGDVLRVAVISNGPPAPSSNGVIVHDLLIDETREVSVAFQSPAAPSAVLIGADGLVASAVANGPVQIDSLVASAVEERAFAPSLVGNPS